MDLVGLLVGNFNAELLLVGWLAIGAVGVFPEGKRIAYLLNGHHDLNGVQAVKTEVVGEVGNAGDLIGMGVSVVCVPEDPGFYSWRCRGQPIGRCRLVETDLAGVGNLKSARKSAN